MVAPGLVIPLVLERYGTMGDILYLPWWRRCGFQPCGTVLDNLYKAVTGKRHQLVWLLIRLMPGR